jgi:uncharacterized coiled-coil protein SlyX
MQEYIDIDEHAQTPLEQLAEVMADFPTHANCEQLTIILARRLAAVEAAQDFTANTLGELVAHEHLEVENRLAAVEETQAADTLTINGLVEDVESQEMDGERQARLENRVAVIEKQPVNIVCHKTTALETKALLDSMQRQLDLVEARLAQYAMRLAESDVNLQDCMDRIVAMEKAH